MHIRHLMWEFKDNKNEVETGQKMCNVYGRGVIINYQVQNWFSKIHSGDTSLR